MKFTQNTGAISAVFIAMAFSAAIIIVFSASTEAVVAPLIALAVVVVVGLGVVWYLAHHPS